ncbi:MAG: glycosyltransferase family 2 protein [Lachnospiraceae bacterium]|nr:glycosyltransferase family 2 protein [Lachnospiraceae bacterium]
MSNVLIMIPAYNEEENIERVVDHLIQNFPQYDYVVINDGSKDKTGEICRRRGYNFLDLPVNLGLAGAFQAGIRYAYAKGYECAIQLDGDGQHRPDFVGDMKKKMDEGYDIVIGSRFINEKKPMTMRMLGSNLLQFAIRITTGADIKDPTSGMRMFSRKMIREFAQGLNYGPEPDTVSYLVKQGAKVAEVPVIMDERISGTSYLTPVRAAKYMTQMLVSILLIQNFRKRDRS